LAITFVTNQLKYKYLPHIARNTLVSVTFVFSAAPEQLNLAASCGLLIALSARFKSRRNSLVLTPWYKYLVNRADTGVLWKMMARLEVF